MFRRLKMRFAKRKDAVRVTELFRELSNSLCKNDIEDLIKDKKVIIFKKKKNVTAAFSFVKIGILGILSFLYIRRFVVDRKFRGRGFGSLIIHKMKKFTRRKKAHGFFLWSRKPVIRFYRRNKLVGLWRVFWWRNKK